MPAGLFNLKHYDNYVCLKSTGDCISNTDFDANITQET